MKEKEDKKEIYFKRVYDNIKNTGYHTTTIMEERNFTPYAYSTGIFDNFNIPELFISGLGPNLSEELIKNYAEKFKFGKIPLNERINDLSDRFPVYLIKIDNKDLAEYVLTSIKFYESREYEYFQLVFPDLNGKFPNEVEYDYDQKIIGDFVI